MEKGTKYEKPNHNRPHHTTQKSKDWATRIPQNKNMKYGQTTTGHIDH